MYILVFVCLFFSSAGISFAQDSIIENNIKLSSEIVQKDSAETLAIIENKVKVKRQKLLHPFKPYCCDTAKKFVLRNTYSPFGQKVLRGSGFVFAAQSLTVGLLLAIPEHTSNWNKKSYRENYKEAFTKPPKIDGDKWYINYLGHPYQGAYYFNAYRSQGAKFWQSALFCAGHSLFWEYFIESGFERPSIQDMIVTPLAGSLLGELFHFSTVRMSRNGFKWYEAAFVSIFNPMFAINNGFKKAKPKALNSVLIPE